MLDKRELLVMRSGYHTFIDDLLLCIFVFGICSIDYVYIDISISLSLRIKAQCKGNN